MLISAMTIYTILTFRHDLPPDLGPMGKQLGPSNPYGMSALFVMPVCLLASTVFSESVWQRVWAANSAKALQQGGAFASVAVSVAVFLFGLAGFLAAWGGLIDVDRDDPNLYLFQLLKKNPDDKARVDSWPSVAVLVLASTMNEGAIDSLQNGILASLHALLPRNTSLLLLRLLVVSISGVLVLIALKDFAVLEIFLITNMICTCSFLPFLLGAWDSPTGRRCVTESSLLLSIISSVLAVCIYGMVGQWGQKAGRTVAGDIMAGLHFAWMGNGYNWDYFAVAAGTSLLVLCAAAVCNLCLCSLRYFPKREAGQRPSRGPAVVSLRPTACDEQQPKMCLLSRDAGNEDESNQGCWDSESSKGPRSKARDRLCELTKTGSL